MITSVRLQNWTSFGALQTAPLSPITVLVGANNSGKSNFLRAVRTFQTWDGAPHRPTKEGADVIRGLSWAPDISWEFRAKVAARSSLAQFVETIQSGASTVLDNTLHVDGGGVVRVRGTIFSTASRDSVLGGVLNGTSLPENDRDCIAPLHESIAHARFVHLQAHVARGENQLQHAVTVQPSGAQLAALVARWTLEATERLDEFNAILRRCLPELESVHAPPSSPGSVRLEFRQRDGERFDTNDVSDGVILFTALVAHALEAPENGLVLIEEPERGLHPRRLAELLDVMRTLVETRKTQFILATHSPALLTLFRDEPEAILLFRRTDEGTQIRRLSDVPVLVSNLERADPGELLASGAFNEEFKSIGSPEAAE